VLAETQIVHSDGTLSAIISDGIAFLQLHHGNRRVTIEEAEALLGK
jgi:hypothetical protein